MITPERLAEIEDRAKRWTGSDHSGERRLATDALEMAAWIRQFAPELLDLRKLALNLAVLNPYPDAHCDEDCCTLCGKEDDMDPSHAHRERCVWFRAQRWKR